MNYVYIFNSVMALVYMIMYFRLRSKYNHLSDFTMRLSDDAIIVKRENDQLKEKLYG